MKEELKRKPIKDNSPISIELVEAPLELSDFIPKHYFKFSEGEVLPEAEEMYSSFLRFLETNQELITNLEVMHPEEYSKGFKQSVSITKLWIESMYLIRGEENKAE